MSCCCCCCPSAKVQANQNTGGPAPQQAGQQSSSQSSPNTRVKSLGSINAGYSHSSISQSNEEQVAPVQQRSRSRSLLDRFSLSRKGSNDREPSVSAKVEVRSPRAPVEKRSFSSSHQNSAEDFREQPSQKYSQAVRKPGGLSSYPSSSSQVSVEMLSRSAAPGQNQPGSNSQAQFTSLFDVNGPNSNGDVLSSSSAPERETMGVEEHPFAVNRPSVASTETGSMSSSKSIPSAPSSGASGKEAQVLAMRPSPSSLDASAKPLTSGGKKLLPPLPSVSITALRLMIEEREANSAPQEKDVGVEQI